MAQRSWKSGGVAHYGSTTDTLAPVLSGKRLGEPAVNSTMVPRNGAEAFYTRLHALETEGNGE